MHYLDLLEHSFKTETEWKQEKTEEKLKYQYSRLEYLSSNIFDFTTYDSGMDKILAKMAVNVVNAITAKTTFDFIEKSDSNYQEYIMMVNMPFFEKRLDWGTSIRGAWWTYDDQKFDSCGLYIGDDQQCDWSFTNEEWVKFMQAVVEFAKPEMEEAKEDAVVDIPLPNDSGQD